MTWRPCQHRVAWVHVLEHEASIAPRARSEPSRAPARGSRRHPDLRPRDRIALRVDDPALDAQAFRHFHRQGDALARTELDGLPRTAEELDLIRTCRKLREARATVAVGRTNQRIPIGIVTVRDQRDTDVGRYLSRGPAHDDLQRGASGRRSGGCAGDGLDRRASNSQLLARLLALLTERRNRMHRGRGLLRFALPGEHEDPQA